MDLGAFAMGAVSRGTIYAYPSVFALGALSSVGPCAAPRIFAVSGLISEAKRPALIAGAFVAGTLLVYAMFACVSSYVAQLVSIASYVYAVVGALALASALWMLAGAEFCVHRERTLSGGSVGAAFLSGAGFALLVSPCCTPIVGAIIAYSGAVGVHFPLASILLLVAFGLGHASPIFAVVAFGRRPFAWLAASRYSQITTMVMASLMLVVGLYYVALV